MVGLLLASQRPVIVAGDDVARSDWLENDPISVRVHDGFVEASGAGGLADRG